MRGVASAPLKARVTGFLSPLIRLVGPATSDPSSLPTRRSLIPHPWICSGLAVVAMPVVYSVVAEYGRTIGPGNTGYWGRAVAACCCLSCCCCRRQYCRASAGWCRYLYTFFVSIVRPLQARMMSSSPPPPILPCLLSAEAICVVDVVTTTVVSIVGPLQAGVVTFILSSSVL